MTNQEALDYLKNRDEIITDGYDYYGEVPYGKSLQYTTSVDTLQKAINELQNLKENYIGFEDMNYELKVYKKAFDLSFGLLVMALIKLEGIVNEKELKQSILDKAKEELENDR